MQEAFFSNLLDLTGGGKKSSEIVILIPNLVGTKDLAPRFRPDFAKALFFCVPNE